MAPPWARRCRGAPRRAGTGCPTPSAALRGRASTSRPRSRRAAERGRPCSRPTSRPCAAWRTSLWLPQFRRSGESDIHTCAPRVPHRAVDEREAAVDPMRQECSVLVVRLHDQAAPLEGAKVLREREGPRPDPPCRTPSTAMAYCPELVDERDARILDSVSTSGVVVGVGPQRRLAVDDPAVDAVLRTCSAQMRVAGALSTLSSRMPSYRPSGASRPGEDVVHRVGPVGRAGEWDSFRGG